ncbi:MAG TPA: biotin/lipoyl-binding carrier protein [Sporichthyaceae bacterium]|jgi:biotin carboxyl carrier protein
MRVCAELVGTVAEVLVEEGEAVRVGAPLVVLESMKMEIPVLAPVAGTVASVVVGVGDLVQAEDPLVVLQRISP